ncbi:signal transduction histidine kinase [Bacillus sp. SLBN-46]|nr:signal transduction histidine kinase [Bacillus sp. SLBN-46]
MTRKKMVYLNLFTAVTILLIYIISLITKTNLIPIWLPFISLTIIIAGFNNALYKGQSKYIGFILLSLGIILILISFSLLRG